MGPIAIAWSYPSSVSIVMDSSPSTSKSKKLSSSCNWSSDGGLNGLVIWEFASFEMVGIAEIVEEESYCLLPN